MIISQEILDDIREKTSISNLISNKVTWDKKKTNHSKGDFWAPCPFHSEKTASFHVDDVKGYYYCFGCHKKGDAITFKMEAENFSFIEAVKILADEAGVNLPDRHITKVADKNKPLREIVNLAKNFFKAQLGSSSAMRARTYLSSRNIEDSEITDFELGFAPQGPETLVNILREKGYQDSEIIESGNITSPLSERVLGRTPVNNISDEDNNIIVEAGEIISDDHLTIRTSVIGPELDKDGEQLFNWFMNQKDEVNGYADAIWSGVTSLELAHVVSYLIKEDLRGLYHVTNGLPITKNELLHLFKKATNKKIDIGYLSGININKHFIDTRKDMKYEIPTYEEMIKEMVSDIENNSSLYSHYSLG